MLVSSNSENSKNNKKINNFLKSTGQYIFNDYLKSGNKTSNKNNIYGTSSINISKNNLLYIKLFIYYLKYFLPLESNSKVRLLAKPTKQETIGNLYNDSLRIRSLKKNSIVLSSTAGSGKSDNQNIPSKERIMKGTINKISIYNKLIIIILWYILIISI